MPRTNTRLHPWTEATEETSKVRQALLQEAQPDRDHVRQVEGLAACRNAIRQMPEGFPVSHRPRSTHHLLAMSPDPRLEARCGLTVSFQRQGSDNRTLNLTLLYSFCVVV